MATEERVLCFERKLFENLGVFQGLTLEVERYLPVITSASQLVYLNRSDAENDRRYKQLIPYVLLLCHDKILRYQRGKRGQETRLHGLFSVGIGGHISEEDHGLFSNDRGYQESMRRELMEEASIKVDEVTYYATQPWPFPSSLMIGCFAKANSREVKVDENELAELRWLERGVARDLIAGKRLDGMLVPPPIAIAYHLIKSWALGENER